VKIRNVEADPVARLVEALKKFPGVGPRGAQRMAMHILRSPAGFADDLAQRIREVGFETRFCSRCGNISTSDPCPICADPGRDGRILCVVEEPADVAAIEKTGKYRGMYYVLHGALSPMDGVGPEDIKIEGLTRLIEKEGINEIILATNLDAEGDATAHYLANQFKSLKVKITRIARGAPVGSDLQYVDEITLGESISGRREVGEKTEKN